jgi:hypothetical protein
MKIKAGAAGLWTSALFPLLGRAERFASAFSQHHTQGLVELAIAPAG